MRTVGNPGSFLMVEGSLHIVDGFVLDADTGKEITLATMLKAFLIDPEENVTGPIRIVVEPALERVVDIREPSPPPCPWYGL